MERPRPVDILKIGGMMLGMYALSFLAFTKAQRSAIVERDGGKCQFPADHPCNGQAQLQVHHIIPQRYAKEVGIENPDFAENGITFCEISHQEKIHPDMFEARQHYHKDSGAYDKAFKEREEKLKRKETYWNTTWDRVLHVIAVRNTQRAISNGWKFPEPKEK